MSIKLLAVGDMHLGRRPSRLPEQVVGRERRYGPAEAWKRTVDRAIESGVDVVALAGDVVEHDDDFFEAYRDLRDGVQRLAQNNIVVVGISGNHDVHVLPRLAGELPDFHLLGQNGSWEAFTIERHNEHLTLHGWSFPQKQVMFSPVADHEFIRSPGINLGLLHCDRDQRDSRYAPVRASELAAAGLDGWLLGHIHKPDDLQAPHPSGYLGSLTGLHPGEYDARGPWLIDIEHGQINHVEQWLLAPLQWMRLDLDLTGLSSPDDIDALLNRALRDLENELVNRQRPPLALGLRIRLTGRTSHASAVAARLKAQANVASSHELHAFIETVTVATRPEIDLQRIMEDEKGRYPALLAERLLLLDQPAEDPRRQRLIEQVRSQLKNTVSDSRWSGLEEPALDDGQIVEWLGDMGIRLLEDLQHQSRRELAR